VQDFAAVSRFASTEGDGRMKEIFIKAMKGKGGGRANYFNQGKLFSWSGARRAAAPHEIFLSQGEIEEAGIWA